VSGQVGKACNGVGDDRTCDSSENAMDGFCDACPITGGESTQNEMFILTGSYYVAPATGGALRAGEGEERSMETEFIAPAVMGCTSSHADHAAHGEQSAHGEHADRADHNADQ
jgi:hypothetical protein